MLRVRLATEPPAEWVAFHAADPRATLFLHPRWTAAMRAAYPRYRARCLVAEADGRLAGLLPFMEYVRYGLRQVLSLPFGTHGGPLLAPGADVAAVAGGLAGALRRRIAAPLVMRFEMSIYDPPPEVRSALAPPLGPFFQERATHVVDLTAGFETLWSGGYDKNTRNCVRLAERQGVTVTAETGDEALDILARLYGRQSAGWEGTRPHPRAALAAITGALGEDARIYIARREGAPLAACLVLDHPPGDSNAWVSGAEPEARPVRGFHLLCHTAIRDACARGRARFGFGGSVGKSGVEYFKIAFGARPVPVLRCWRSAGWIDRLRGGGPR